MASTAGCSRSRTDLSPSTTPSSTEALRPMWQCRPRIDRRTTASWLIRVFAQRIDALDDGVLLDVALPADDAVWADARAGLHDGALVDEAGPFDDGALLDARLRRHPGRARRVGERRRRDSGRP